MGVGANIETYQKNKVGGGGLEILADVNLDKIIFKVRISPNSYPGIYPYIASVKYFNFEFF